MIFNASAKAELKVVPQCDFSGGGSVVVDCLDKTDTIVSSQ